MNNDRKEASLESISKKFQLEWILQNYSLKKKDPGICIWSPEFRFEFDGYCSKWMIQLHPGGADATCADFVSAFLYLIDTKHENLIVSCEFVLFNSKSKTMGRMEFNPKPFKKGHGHGFLRLISRQNLLSNISRDGYLKIISNLKVLYKVENVLSYSPISDHQSSVINDLDKMRADGDFSDITIAVGVSEFKAHKNILAARSPVFFSMFKHEMKEANSGRVEIKDIESEVFEEFLKYIYTGNANIKEHTVQLLAAADKYHVQDLKTACEDILIKNLTKENCFKILVLSELRSAKKLKEQTIAFIVSRTSLEDKDGLAEIKDVSLLKELIEAFMNKNKE